MLSFLNFLNQQSEEVAANNVGSGNVKGIAPGEDPPVKKKKKDNSHVITDVPIKHVF